MGLCYFHETYSITEKIFQLLVCNKDSFIKPEAALSERLSLNTKTFAFSNVLFASNDHQESFEKKLTWWSSIRKHTIKRTIQYIPIWYLRNKRLLFSPNDNRCSFFYIFTFLISLLTIVYDAIY